MTLDQYEAYMDEARSLHIAYKRNFENDLFSNMLKNNLRSESPSFIDNKVVSFEISDIEKKKILADETRWY